MTKLKTNELMSGLICECGHDYACHAPAPHFHCGECDCKRSRVQIADHGGEIIADLLTALQDIVDFMEGRGQWYYLNMYTEQTKAAIAKATPT